MKTVLRIFFILLAIATGGVFLYSAYTKLMPIESFEYTMVEFLHIPLIAAAIVARFFIGLEIGLGSLIILHLWGKGKWVLKAAFALLVAFSIYLIALWIKDGNNVNCGCFGDAIWMSPSSSLIKNGILLVVIGILLRFHKGLKYTWAQVSALVALPCAIVTMYIALPIFKPYKIDLHAVYADPKYAPSADLSKGKHIIAFLSPSCIHCRRAALKMHLMKKADSTLPFYMIIGGVDTAISGFWKASDAQDLPHTRLARDPFFKYTGGIFPTILWVNNGRVEASTGYPELNILAIKHWMAQDTVYATQQ